MRRLLLDIGHSNLSLGAVSAGGKVQEYDMNKFQAKILKRELEFDFSVDVIDPEKDDRVAIGLKAKGYNIFISLHLNAYRGKSNYTTICVDTRHNTPTSRSSKLASVCATSISKALQIPLYQGVNFPPGVMPAHLEVLNYAHRSGCELCFLVESFFIDAYSDRAVIENNCEIAMKALASTLRKAVA